MHAFMISFRKVFVNPNFDDLDLDKLGLKFWDVTEHLQCGHVDQCGLGKEHMQ